MAEEGDVCVLMTQRIYVFLLNLFHRAVMVSVLRHLHRIVYREATLQSQFHYI